FQNQILSRLSDLPKKDREQIEETYTALRLIQEHKLHVTDALIYATAVNHDCKLLTGDPHFKGKLGVMYLGD
ncbi:MAG TPA: PIN domain-containing protein, partial [Candidatus Norongarragalinales archaeon]|nr:PIN domain-containing protein [Candidatus Norongarragalinales archaeon]